MAAIRLVIFEDNTSYRESLKQFFLYSPDIDVVGAFADCEEVSTSIAALLPDVVLMDIDMPGMSGVDATGIIKTIAPQTQVMMLTVSEDEGRIFQSLRNGATGYLLKKTDPDELLDSVRSVHQGGSPMSPSIARKVLHHFHLSPNPTTTTTAKLADQEAIPAANRDQLNTLTPREYEILMELVDGLSYKMIAVRLDISAETVKNHIQGVYKKLHVNSKSEAIILAMKSGVVPGTTL